MSRAGSQQRTVLGLLAELRPHWWQDRALPARIQTLLARNRAFGSRDRRLYRELIYTALRYLPWIERHLDERPEFAVQLLVWLAADSPLTEPLRAGLLPGGVATPSSLAGKVAMLNGQGPSGWPPAASPGDVPSTTAELLPGWLREEAPDAFSPEQLEALLRRAPLWLRLRTPGDPAVPAEFAALGWRLRPAAELASAVQVLEPVDVTKSTAYLEGRIEVQDLGSQLVLAGADIAPGSKWLDACAGAGGKTLQLAQRVGPAGHVDAFDIRPAALAELTVRAQRAGAANIAALSRAPAGTYDGVLVDAPCSGSGTWRRAPHLKWTTTAAHVAEAAQLQRRLLHECSARVRPGGQLIYATCSLCRSENEDVVAAFLAEHVDYACGPGAPGLRILPAQHDTDGFFVAHLQRQT